MKNNGIKRLAAYFYMQDYRNHMPCENMPIDINHEEYYTDAENIGNIYTDLSLCNFDNADQKVIYAMICGILDKYYDKSKFNHAFKRMYQLFFETDTGPRLPSFIMIYGIDNFLTMYYNRMNDPFKQGVI